jgi:hypothetical protein
LQLPLCRTQPAAAVEGVGIIRLEPDRLIVIHNRAIIVALGLVGDTAAVKGIGVFRVELNCLVEVRNRAVRVALGEMAPPGFWNAMARRSGDKPPD